MRLLVIEGNIQVRKRLKESLSRAGYVVDVQSNGDEGLWAAQEGSYDVVILNMGIPGLKGMEILRRLREAESPVQVLATGSRDDLKERLQALDAGADDYLVKAFHHGELLARVRALIRRGYEKKNPVIRVDDLEIDPLRRRVQRAGQTIELTPLEYRLLEYLGYRAGEVVSRIDIWDRVFEDGSAGTSNVVDVYISALRKKLSPTGAVDLIQTRRGHGYILELPAT